MACKMVLPEQNGARPAKWGETCKMGRDLQNGARPAKWGETCKMGHGRWIGLLRCTTLAADKCALRHDGRTDGRTDGRDDPTI